MDDVITEQVQRLRVLWPALNAKPEVTDEIRRAIMRHEAKLDPSDVVTGFDMVISESPTSGWPPGPHEIVGCVMRASALRRMDAPAPQYPPRTELVNQQCSKCGGAVALIPNERVIYCGACNLVQSLGSVAGRPRYHLEWNEMQALPVRSDAQRASLTGRDALARLRDALLTRRESRKAGTALMPSFALEDEGDKEIGWDDAA